MSKNRKQTLEDIQKFNEATLADYYFQYRDFSISGATPDNSRLRLLTIDLFGESNLLHIQFTGLKILEEVARRYYLGEEYL